MNLTPNLCSGSGAPGKHIDDEWETFHAPSQMYYSEEDLRMLGVHAPHGTGTRDNGEVDAEEWVNDFNQLLWCLKLIKAGSAHNQSLHEVSVP